jgi:hypothetical protein
MPKNVLIGYNIYLVTNKNAIWSHMTVRSYKFELLSNDTNVEQNNS